MKRFLKKNWQEILYVVFIAAFAGITWWLITPEYFSEHIMKLHIMMYIAGFLPTVILGSYLLYQKKLTKYFIFSLIGIGALCIESLYLSSYSPSYEYIICLIGWVLVFFLSTHVSSYGAYIKENL